MRSDVRFSSDSVYLPNASMSGFSKPHAEPGDFVIWQHEGGGVQQGRVVARVDSDCTTPENGMVPMKGWLMIMTLSDTHSDLHVRWVPPDEITECYLSGDWIERSEKALNYFMMPYQAWRKASKDPHAMAKLWGQ